MVHSEGILVGLGDAEALQQMYIGFMADVIMYSEHKLYKRRSLVTSSGS